MKNTLEFVGNSGEIYIAFESFGSFYIMEKSEYEKPVWNDRSKRKADVDCLEECTLLAKWL